jgi:outer membrane protein assembly factor BamB
MAVLTSVLAITACTAGQVTDTGDARYLPAEIKNSSVVFGDLRIRGEVKIFPGAVLSVRPGTRFLFEPYDPDGDGVNDSRITVQGRMVSRGEPDAPIIFTSAAPDPEPGDWLELNLERSEGSVLEYTVLEYARYGLHVHFSSGMVANSVFRNNIDGTRFGNSRFEFIFNRITDNLGKGINFRSSAIRVIANRIDRNRHGVFIFEEGSRSVLGFNAFAQNAGSDIRFGDFYQGDPPGLAGNYKTDGTDLQVMGKEADLDSLMVKSYPAPMAGPQLFTDEVSELWSRDLGSFIDASPVLAGREKELVVAATWDSGLHVLDLDGGRTIARVQAPDITDAAPAYLSGTGEILFPSWDLKVRKADAGSGEVRAELPWDPSPADDHRQASPLLIGDGEAAAMGLWNGIFGSLDTVTMKWNWTRQLDGAIRARAAFDGAHLWVGADSGFLYRISLDGELLEQLEMTGAVRTTPLPVDGGVVVVTADGVLTRIKDGKAAWRRKLPGPGTYASPVWLSSMRNFFAVGDGSGVLSAYSVDGALMWRTVLGSAVHVLAGAEDLTGVVAGTQDGELHIIDYFGRSSVKLGSGGAIHGVVIDAQAEPKAKATVVWGSRDGTVRAVQVNEENVPWEPPLD